MPKRKPRVVDGFEKELIALLDAVVPGSIEMSRTNEIFDGRAGFCITFMTRGATSSLYDDDLTVAVHAVTQDVSSGDRDPLIPMWHRLTRFQREAVTHVLEREAAEHMAAAARVKVGAGPGRRRAGQHRFSRLRCSGRGVMGVPKAYELVRRRFAPGPAVAERPLEAAGE
jgi:hypothetical protein